MVGTVLITGCSSGFGKTAVGRFVEAGWRVVATMRDTADWKATTASENVAVLPLDVQDAGSIRSAMAAAVDRFGRIECVVNNAGHSLLSVFEATPLDAVKRLFEVNVFGPMLVMQAAIPHFREMGGGRFVNVSSSSAIVPDPLMSVYAASKWAVEGFSEGVRYELEGQNITVKLVEPGLVRETNIFRQTAENSEGLPIPPSYQGYHDRIMTTFTRSSTVALATVDEVAATIVSAANDDTDTFRFVVGGDAAKAAQMRRESSEAAYDAWARSRFPRAS